MHIYHLYDVQVTDVYNLDRRGLQDYDPIRIEPLELIQLNGVGLVHDIVKAIVDIRKTICGFK